VLVGVGCDRGFMKAGEIVRAVEAALAERQGSGIEEAIAEAAEWLDVLGRFNGKDGKPSSRRLGRYLSANGRVVDGMCLVMRWDSDAKINEFRVEMQPRGSGRIKPETPVDAGFQAAEEGRGTGSPPSQLTGFPGFYGVSDTPSYAPYYEAQPTPICMEGGADQKIPRITPETSYGHPSLGPTGEQEVEI
jgi:hypothetical protein